MRTVRSLLTIASSGILVAAAAWSADAPKESCYNIKWSSAFLKDYPKAPVTRQEVERERRQ
jgi:hypothetical protein